MEHLTVPVIIKQVKEKKVTMRHVQHGFTKGNSCLTNLIYFYDGVTGWVDEGRAMDVVYLDFSKAFDTVSHNTLTGKLRRHGLDEWTVRWIENWLNGRTQVTLLWQGGWTRWSPGVPSTPYHSVILWFCDSLMSAMVAFPLILTINTQSCHHHLQGLDNQNTP